MLTILKKSSSLILAIVAVVFVVGAYSVSIPLGHGPVCNPRCEGYAMECNVSEFMNDRCCVFIPCPSEDLTRCRMQYDSFRSKCLGDRSEVAEPAEMHEEREFKAGGLGAGRQGTNDDVERAVDAVKAQFQEESKMEYKSIEVLSHKTQTVAGINYFVKAKATPLCGEEKIVHLKIYMNLKRQYNLTAFQIDKKLEDEIEYF